MKNFEVQHTIRIYDPELISAIGKAYEKHGSEFRNKNEFMTYLIRLGVDVLNSTPPTSPASAAVPPAAALDKLYEEVKHIDALSSETGKYLQTQFRKMYIHIAVMERLLSSIYNMKVGDISGTPPIARKVEDGFFDDLPLRFEKLILTLEHSNALK